MIKINPYRSIWLLLLYHLLIVNVMQSKLAQKFSNRHSKYLECNISLARILLTVGTITIIFSLSFDYPVNSFAQSTEQDTKIRGEYSSDEGISINFPAGWNGIKIDNGDIVSIVLIPDDKASQNKLGMSLLTIEIPQKDMKIPLNLNMNKNNNNNNNNTNSSCISLDASYVKFANGTAQQMLLDCKDSIRGQQFERVKIYLLSTPERILSLLFYADSEETFANNIDIFERSVNTLKVKNQKDIRMVEAERLELVHKQHLVQKGEEKGVIDITGNVNVSDFVFSDEKKTLSFNVDYPKLNDDSLLPTVIIPVGSLLEGPYTVFINSQTTLDFLVITDQITNMTEIIIDSALLDFKSDLIIEISGARVISEILIPFTIFSAGFIMIFLLKKFMPYGDLKNKITTD